MVRRILEKKLVGLSMLIAFLVLIPLLTQSQYYLGILILIAIQAIYALSWRLIMKTGQLSFGHAAFVGIGAYASALLVMRVGLSFWLALPLSGVIAMIVSLLIGYPTLRLKGMYFAIVTFCFAEILHSIWMRFRNLFGGATGIYAIPPPNPIPVPGFSSIVFESAVPYYYLALILFGIAVIFYARVDRCRIGKTLASIQQNDSLAESLGINLMWYKLLAFAAASFFTGVAGSFHAHYIGFISPDSFPLMLSIGILIYAMVGGLGTITGPIVGTAFLILVGEFLPGGTYYKMMLFSVVLMVVILFLPRGLEGVPEHISRLIIRFKRKE